MSLSIKDICIFQVILSSYSDERGGGCTQEEVKRATGNNTFDVLDMAYVGIHHHVIKIGEIKT